MLQNRKESLEPGEEAYQISAYASLQERRPRVLKRDDTFLVIEKWESMDALKAHAAAPHMAAYGAKTKEMIASRTIHILSPA